MGFPFANIFSQNSQSAATPPVNQQSQQTGKLPNGETSTLENTQTPQNPQNQQPGQPQNQQTEPPSPLDPFKDLWQPDPTPKDGTPPGNDKPGLTYDPAKVRESVKKLDFSKVIDPALAQKALAGDVAAFSQVVGTVAQAAVSSAMTANLGILNSALERHEGRIFEKLPTEMRRFSASDATFTDNPALNHPAVRPIFEVVQQQFVKKFPDASTADIRKMASEYMTGALKVMNPDKGDGKDKQGEQPGDLLSALQGSGKQENWDEFFGVSSSQ